MEKVITEGNTIMVYPYKTRLVLYVASVCAFVTGLGFFLTRSMLHLLNSLPGSSSETDVINTFGPWIIVVECIILFTIQASAVVWTRRPSVTLSPAGLEIAVGALQTGPFYWNEIAEVQAYTSIYRYVKVVFNDPDRVYQRLMDQHSGSHIQWYIRLLYRQLWYTRLIYRRIPYFRRLDALMNTISIPEECLPMLADELAERIRVYRLALPAA